LLFFTDQVVSIAARDSVQLFQQHLSGIVKEKGTDAILPGVIMNDLNA